MSQSPLEGMSSRVSVGGMGESRSRVPSLGGQRRKPPPSSLELDQNKRREVSTAPFVSVSVLRACVSRDGVWTRDEGEEVSSGGGRGDGGARPFCPPLIRPRQHITRTRPELVALTSAIVVRDCLAVLLTRLLFALALARRPPGRPAKLRELIQPAPRPTPRPRPWPRQRQHPSWHPTRKLTRSNNRRRQFPGLPASRSGQTRTGPRLRPATPLAEEDQTTQPRPTQKSTPREYQSRIPQISALLVPRNLRPPIILPGRLIFADLAALLRLSRPSCAYPAQIAYIESDIKVKPAYALDWLPPDAGAVDDRPRDARRRRRAGHPALDGRSLPCRRRQSRGSVEKLEPSLG